MESLNSVEELHAIIANVEEATRDRRTRKERRKTREPPAIKELRSLRRNATSEKARRHLQNLIWEGRKHWLDTLRRIRQTESFNRGKPIWHAKKLRDVTAMHENRTARAFMTRASGVSSFVPNTAESTSAGTFPCNPFSTISCVQSIEVGSKWWLLMFKWRSVI